MKRRGVIIGWLAALLLAPGSAYAEPPPVTAHYVLSGVNQCHRTGSVMLVRIQSRRRRAARARSSTSSISCHCGCHFCHGHFRTSCATRSGATRPPSNRGRHLRQFLAAMMTADHSCMVSAARKPRSASRWRQWPTLPARFRFQSILPSWIVVITGFPTRRSRLAAWRPTKA